MRRVLVPLREVGKPTISTVPKHKAFRIVSHIALPTSYAAESRSSSTTIFLIDVENCRGGVLSFAR
jgi:hypothetical protein